MYSSNLIFLIFVSYACKSLHSLEYGIKIGAKINICCSLLHNLSQPLFIWHDTNRLASLHNNAFTFADFEVFAAVYKGFKVFKANDTLCITKEISEIGDGSIKFRCSVSASPFGATISQQEFFIKIFEELKFVTIISSLTNVTQGNDVTIECAASGSPDLKVLWRKEGEGIISKGDPSATLLIKNVNLMMDGDKYTCEASTSLPKDSPESMIQQTTSLNVYFPPEIDVAVKAFHTDLGTKEVVEIMVKGNPMPQMDCRSMDIAADRIITISKGPKFSYMYSMEFDNITTKHIGHYTCSVSNSVGKVEKTISLILGPMNLRITSLNETNYANYYLLKWEAESKTKIHTSKIFINVYNNSIDSKLIESRVMEGKELSPILISSGNKDNNWRYQYSHHLMNLTSNKLHNITVEMCRKDYCIVSNPSAFVQTPQYNGNNVMTASELKSNPSPGSESPGRGNLDAVPLNVWCVLGANVIIIRLLY